MIFDGFHEHLHSAGFLADAGINATVETQDASATEYEEEEETRYRRDSTTGPRYEYKHKVLLQGENSFH